LPPESAPTGPFEAVAVSGIGEGSFHEVLAPFAIGFGRSGSSLSFGSVQQGLIPVAVDGSTAVGAGAVIGDLIIKSVAKKPHVVDSLRNDAHVDC